MLKRLIFAVFVGCLASPAMAANWCYVSEFPDAAQPVAITPPLVDQQIPVSVSAASSNAFSGNTKIVRISCDTTVSAAFGANPTATTTNLRISANMPEYFYVIAGQKVSFITNQ